MSIPRKPLPPELRGTPTGRAPSQPEMQNIPGTPTHALEMAYARHGMPAPIPSPGKFVYKPRATAAAAPGFKPSEQQANFFDWVVEGKGSCLLEAVAGAGKTTTLIEALRLMEGGVFFGAYNRKIADEIKAKAEKSKVSRRGLYISTMHGVGYAAWIEKYKDVKVVDRKVAKIVEDLAEKQPIYGELAGFICKLASFGKQFIIGVRGKTPIDDLRAWGAIVQHFGIDQELPDDMSVDAAVELMLPVYRKSIDLCPTSIDFDDMIFAPLYYNLRFYQNDWVLIDERQDTNPARRELAHRLLKPKTGRLVAVGDTRQAIYGFTGADGGTEKFISEFGCVQMPLTVTYRCPKAVVAYVQQWVSHIQAHPDAPEGVVRQMLPPVAFDCVRCEGTGAISLQANNKRDAYVSACPDCTGAGRIAADKDKRPWFLRDKPTEHDAILCRYTAPLIKTAFSMIREGLACKVEGRDIGQGLKALASRWKVKSLDALDTRLGQWHEREVAKARAAKSERAEQEVTDKVDTLRVFMQRCREQGIHTLAGLLTEIDALFADDVKGVCTLSTGHKSKGREWPRVYWIQTAVRARNLKEWEAVQEENIRYVIGTRSQGELILVPEAAL